PFVLRDPGQHGINSVAFSSDDRYLASAGADGKVTVWDVATRTTVRSWVAHTNGFGFCVAFDPTDSARLVSAGADNPVKLWDWNSTNLVQSWPIGFSFQWGMANAVAFSPNGQHIAASVGLGAVTVWSARTGEKVAMLTGQSENGQSPVLTVFSIVFSP